MVWAAQRTDVRSVIRARPGLGASAVWARPADGTCPMGCEPRADGTGPTAWTVPAVWAAPIRGRRPGGWVQRTGKPKE
nr:hypothetical protein StreXyl84_03390 [Streptomyces sp. Xyl84]